MKIFSFIFLFFLSFLNVYSDNELNIISREEWGVNNEYLDINSNYWKEIIQKKIEKKQNSEIDYNEIKRTKEFKKIVSENINNKYSKTLYIKNFDGKKLAWPVEKSEKIKSIVIHHTHTKYPGDINSIQKIYKYHALNNEWGDIGYNYLIGYNGEIYEGRLGGDKAIGAHTKRNNIGSVGIALVGDYDNEKINNKQYESLEKLVKSLVEKYEIDLTKKTTYLKSCIEEDCESYLTKIFDSPIIGHRDAGHTDCPGDELYYQIQKIKENIKTKQLIFKRLKKLNKKQLEYVLYKLNFYIKYSSNKKEKAIYLKNIVKEYLEKN